MSGNSTAQFANCRDWRGGSVKRRYATIEDIAASSPQSSKSAGPTCPTGACANLPAGLCHRLLRRAAALQALRPRPGLRRSPLTRAKPIRRPERLRAATTGESSGAVACTGEQTVLGGSAGMHAALSCWVWTSASRPLARYPGRKAKSGGVTRHRGNRSLDPSVHSPYIAATASLHDRLLGGDARLVFEPS